MAFTCGKRRGEKRGCDPGDRQGFRRGFDGMAAWFSSSRQAGQERLPAFLVAPPHARTAGLRKVRGLHIASPPLPEFFGMKIAATEGVRFLIPQL